MPTSRKHSVTLHFEPYVIPAKTITLSYCGECPYCCSNMGMGEPSLCSHPKAPKGFYKNSVGAHFRPPDWCPGRK